MGGHLTVDDLLADEPNHDMNKVVNELTACRHSQTSFRKQPGDKKAALVRPRPPETADQSGLEPSKKQ